MRVFDVPSRKRGVRQHRTGCVIEIDTPQQLLTFDCIEMKQLYPLSERGREKLKYYALVT